MAILRDEVFLNANGVIGDFSADDNNSASFKFKTADHEIIVERMLKLGYH